MHGLHVPIDGLHLPLQLYTVSDKTKQILYKSVIDARAFTDGSIKKLAPMVLGGILIVV